ncbi:MAG: hypothetical protein K1X33_09455 [Methanobacteriaceae archaeon]|nr:hypothetical protein [Methanobacteriaceae archaeon]
MNIKAYDNDIYKFYESIRDLIASTVPGGGAISCALKFFDLMSSFKLNKFIENFDENDKEKLDKLIDTKDDDLFRILEMFDKAMKSESLWVIRCLAQITKKLIKKEVLNDDELFYCDTLPDMNDNDLEFFCNLKKMWNNKEIIIRSQIQSNNPKSDIASLEARLKHKCVRPELEDLSFLNIATIDHAYARIDRLVKFGVISGDTGGYGMTGQAHGYAVWGSLSEKLYDFIIKYK